MRAVAQSLEEILAQIKKSVAGEPGTARTDAAEGAGEESGDRSIADLIYLGQCNEIGEVVIALSDSPRAGTTRLVEDLSKPGLPPREFARQNSEERYAGTIFV